MARLSAQAGPVGDLVDEFLTSQAVTIVRHYAGLGGGHNPVTRACDELRHGRPAVVDSGLLPREVSREFFDTEKLVHVRVRLQRGHRPQIVHDRPPVVPEDAEEPTAQTQPLDHDEVDHDEVGPS